MKKTKNIKLFDVNINALNNLKENADQLNSTAMQLTDAWGSVMFVLDPKTVKKTFETIGFNSEVSESIYETVKSIYAVSKSDDQNSKVVTWHGTPATIMLLKGIKNIKESLSDINDSNLEEHLSQNETLLNSLIELQNESYGTLLFSPKIASDVISVFGAKVSPEKIYQLAIKYGALSTSDVEGRKGISSKFIRSMTHILAAKAA